MTLYRKYTFNITPRHVRIKLLQSKSNNYYIFECVFVALGTQHATRVLHIVICGLSSFRVFFNITSQPAQFSKNNYWTKNVF
jgi:hypothetical protein